MKKKSETMQITLCVTCVKQFYNSPEHTVRRADPKQKIKDTCGWCNGIKTGWDYEITRTVKR